MKKKVLLFFILIISYVLISLVFSNQVMAVNQIMGTDINSINSDKYPQFKQMLQEIKSKHPNWNFKILYTDIDWKEAIANEYTGHGSSPRNIIPVNGYSNEWVCSVCGANKKYDNGSWHCASEAAIAYMMDSRNSINESDMFQFLELSYNGYNNTTINKMISGTFLDNSSYINAVINAAKTYNVNPYYIIARIIQEQGKNGSTLCKGQGYEGQYVGYYNVFNIGATGSGKANVILNGLKKAKSKGWTSMESSITGGVEVIASSYIKKGQNTIYFQKFDVENSDGNLYWHQYMQNVMAAQSEGATLKKTFSSCNSLDGEYTFIIPVFKNMPTNACPRPGTTNNQIPTSSELVKVNVTGSLRLRNEPNGSTTVGWIYKNDIVTRLSKGTTKINGTYWDYVMKSDGTKGYAARETYESESTYKLYLVPINDNSNQTPETSQENDDVQNNTNQNKLNGDVNTDGIRDSADLLYLKKSLLNKVQLTEKQTINADTNNDNNIDSADLLNVKKFLLGKITL